MDGVDLVTLLSSSLLLLVPARADERKATLDAVIEAINQFNDAMRGTEMGSYGSFCLWSSKGWSGWMECDILVICEFSPTLHFTRVPLAN